MNANVRAAHVQWGACAMKDSAQEEQAIDAMGGITAARVSFMR